MSIHENQKDTAPVTNTANDPLHAAHLKENVISVAREMRDVSSEKMHEAGVYASNHLAELRSSSNDILKKAEAHVKEKPGQSVALAFAAGLFVRYLLGRRTS
jgi:ElaB/YqjD/DUF883 family membrane-anchored ribosome-binding protein